MDAVEYLLFAEGIVFFRRSACPRVTVTGGASGITRNALP
jgi:hypothetical protein